MDIRTTTIYEQNAAAWLNRKNGTRRAFNEGGTWASKTYSILQLIMLVTKHTKRPLISSVVSESMPHLKRGCIRDFMNIMGDDFIDARWNKTDKIYVFGKGIMEFFSADEPSKMRGGRRDILFVNEANNIPYNGFRELDIRTKLFTFADWNPVAEFWYHENNLKDRPENVYIHSVYGDAKEVIPPEIVKDIESNKDTDPNWWNVYGLGRLGKVEGLVHPYFTQCDALPGGGEHFFGLDFGYGSDPAVLIENAIIGRELYSRQLIYEKGMTNDDLALRMIELGIKKHYDEIFADSAEPKSIAEIYGYGFNIKGAPKGPDSVRYGHKAINKYKQYWTKDSLDCIKEQRNYSFVRDKNGVLTDKTTHRWGHGMDARRYGLVGYLLPEPTEAITTYDSMQLVGSMDLE